MEVPLGTKSSSMAIKTNLEQIVKEKAMEYPDEDIIIFAPIALYKAKVSVELTKFSVNTKGETFPS